MKTQDTLIMAHGLTKNFTSFKKEPGISGTIKGFFKRNPITKSAVTNFDFVVKKGEIVGLLGPNGAGKTTLMKMFTGIIVPSDGELKVMGHNPWERDKEFRKKIALVMGQKSQLWWDIPAMDSFLLLQKYYEISESDFKDRINMMSELLDVKKLMHVQIRRLSLGERMKLELMASLLHSPEIIFLDEPTIGLDLVAQENIRSFIQNYHREKQCSIIITSHYMADVQALCQRLTLILDGKKGFDGPLRQFEKILGNEKVVTFTFEKTVDAGLEFWKKLDPKWNENYSQVELRIPEAELRKCSLEIIEKFPVIDFATEKMPIERVMKTLMNNPKLLTDGAR
ncbi:MAG: ABC transporter ATP-binding protein [Bacteriovoracaceae bacterium]